MKKLFAIATMAIMLCLTGLVMTDTAFAQQCVDNGDGTVTDNGTGLMWQKVWEGPTTWDIAMSYASSLSLSGHSDWWLPSRYELLDLYHSPCRSLMVLARDSFWSSSTDPRDTNVAWHVNINHGYVNFYLKSGSYHVRAVRTGQ